VAEADQAAGATEALPADLVAAHKQLRADEAIQFHLGQPKEYKPPEWLKALEPIGDLIQAIAPFAKYIFWGMLAALVAAILYYVLREFTDFRFPWQKQAAEEAEEEWLPDAAPARALLAEADALASAGRFGEAAHLILLRSVEDIDARKPDLIKPSSTSREIAAANGLPERARNTFALIARHVEASLFGGRDLDAVGWQECREAYGRFALAGEWQ
jgi:hypothetical protein